MRVALNSGAISADSGLGTTSSNTVPSSSASQFKTVTSLAGRSETFSIEQVQRIINTPTKQFLDDLRGTVANQEDDLSSNSWLEVDQNNAKTRSKRMIHGERMKNFTPFMAAVRYERNLGQMSTCGAAVVSNQHVLTAAHCLDSACQKTH